MATPGMQFQIGSYLFADIANTAGTFAKGFGVTPTQGFVRYHVPGTDGTLLTHMGRHGYSISARFQIVAESTQVCWTTYEAMMLAWADTYVNIIGPGFEKTYERCMLDTDGMNVVLQARATGCEVGQAYIEVEAKFTCDA